MEDSGTGDGTKEGRARLEKWNWYKTKSYTLTSYVDPINGDI
jgi:hypothetical protein